MMRDGIEPTGWAEPEDEPDTGHDGARTAHWGHCEDEDCNATVVIYPRPDRTSDLPARADWEYSDMDCPVCAKGIMWGGTDPAHHLIRNY